MALLVWRALLESTLVKGTYLGKLSEADRLIGELEKEANAMTTEVLTTALGWCLAINLVLLGLAAVVVTGFRSLVLHLHGKLFGLSDDDLVKAYFQYLANYKIAIIVFNLVPYIVLKLMT